MSLCSKPETRLAPLHTVSGVSNVCVLYKTVPRHLMQCLMTCLKWLASIMYMCGFANGGAVKQAESRLDTEMWVFFVWPYSGEGHQHTEYKKDKTVYVKHINLLCKLATCFDPYRVIIRLFLLNHVIKTLRSHVSTTIGSSSGFFIESCH